MNLSSLRKCTKCMIASFFIIAAFFLFAGTSFYHYLSKQSFDVEKLNATVISAPRSLQDFSLTDDQDQPFTLAQLQNHWTLVFFGFTHCEMMCPTTMAELAKMMRSLEGMGEKILPEVLMISIDPERDNAATMKQYVKSFDARFIGLTGKREEISKLTKAMGVVYIKESKQKDENNTVIDHSGSIALLNPKGEIVAFFSYPHNALSMANDFHAIVQHS